MVWDKRIEIEIPNGNCNLLGTVLFICHQLTDTTYSNAVHAIVVGVVYWVNKKGAVERISAVAVGAAAVHHEERVRKSKKCALWWFIFTHSIIWSKQIFCCSPRILFFKLHVYIFKHCISHINHTGHRKLIVVVRFIATLVTFYSVYLLIRCTFAYDKSSVELRIGNEIFVAEKKTNTKIGPRE